MSNENFLSSLNRRLKDPMQFHVTGMDKKTLEEMSKHDGFRNWDCNFQQSSYDEAFAKGDYDF